MMHILGILVFLVALLIAAEAIRSTIVANGEKILAALAGEADALAIGSTFTTLYEPAHVVPFVRRHAISPPVSLPLAA